MYYLDREFEKRCFRLGIKIVDAQYYCNSGIKYEFKDLDSLTKAFNEYMDAALEDPDGVNIKVTLTAYDDTFLLFIHYPEDD